MAQPVVLDLSISFTPDGMEAARQSLLAVAHILEGSRPLRETVAKGFPDLFDADLADGSGDLSLKGLDLIIGEPIHMAADGACEYLFHPSDRYIELVSAIARNGDMSFDFGAHGWPLLSVGMVEQRS